MSPPDTQSLIRLTAASTGRPVRVSRIDGGQGMRGRLCAMGITPGVPMEVVTDGGGPVVLRVLGSRVMVGRGMASRILVREL